MSGRSHAALRVLVVDDDDLDALLTEANLAASDAERYVVTRARSGAEAGASIRSTPADVVLIDYRLGGESGLDVVRDLRATGFDGAILMLTAAGDRRVDLAATDAGADDYLDKVGLDPRLLERAIRHTRENRASRAALEERNAELSRLAEEKNFFLGMAAHDLRSPLGVMAGYARLLRDELGTLPPEEARAMLETVARTADHLVALVDDLLDLSAIAAGTLTLRPIPCDPGAVVAEALEAMRPLARAKGIELVLDTRPSPPASLDRARLVQVVTNLVGNAIKYSHAGGWVRVDVGPVESDVLLTVTDRGVGIPEAARATMFLPFQKGRATGTAGEKSVGLGLSIVQRIVAAHGGTIEAESRLGEGATFRVRLPLRPTESARLQTAGGGTTPAVGGPPWSPKMADAERGRSSSSSR